MSDPTPAGDAVNLVPIEPTAAEKPAAMRLEHVVCRSTE